MALKAVPGSFSGAMKSLDMQSVKELRFQATAMVENQHFQDSKMF